MGEKTKKASHSFQNLDLPLTLSPTLAEAGLILDQLRGGDFERGSVGEKSKIASYTFDFKFSHSPYLPFSHSQNGGATLREGVWVKK